MDFNSLRKEINSKNASVKELINDIFLKIGSKDQELNSYICTTKDSAIAQAENIDKLIQNNKIQMKSLLSNIFQKNLFYRNYLDFFFYT